MVRSIQEQRRNLGLNLTQKIDVVMEKIPVNNLLIEWMTKKAQISGIKKGKFKVTKHP